MSCKARVGYVRTAPFWYPALDELPRLQGVEAELVRKAVAAQVKEQMKDKPESADAKKMEQLMKEAGDKALADGLGGGSCDGIPFQSAKLKSATPLRELDLRVSLPTCRMG